MPIFDYECPICGSEEEVLQKSTDPAPVCEKDSTPMVKVIKKVSTRKGAGLYSVDLAASRKLGNLSDE